MSVGQEADNDERDDNLVLWLGTNYREIVTVEELAGALAESCELPPELQVQLLVDQRIEGHEPTSLQKQMLELIKDFSVRDGAK